MHPGRLTSSPSAVIIVDPRSRRPSPGKFPWPRSSVCASVSNVGRAFRRDGLERARLQPCRQTRRFDSGPAGNQCSTPPMPPRKPRGNALRSGSIAAIDRRGRAFLAKARLRFQCPERTSARRKTPQLCHPDRNRSSRSDDLWSGGTLRLTFHRTLGIECEWTARKRERAAGRLGPSAKHSQAKEQVG